MKSPLATFTGTPTTGAGRGKIMGTPTINLVSNTPLEIPHGIYACIATANSTVYSAVMHYGPSPVYNEPVSIEVHLLDENIQEPPENMTIAVIEHIRDVQDFSSERLLIAQIEQDKRDARGILTT